MDVTFYKDTDYEEPSPYKYFPFVLPFQLQPSFSSLIPKSVYSVKN